MKKLWKAEENRDAFEYARRVTAHYSKSFYFSARMLPREQRWATFALTHSTVSVDTATI